MGTYNLPRNVKGEGRILFVFSTKALIYSTIGAAVGLPVYLIFSILNLNIVGIIAILLFALIAIIIMSVINIFVMNSTFGAFVSIISVVVFLGLTAWDMQSLKRIYNYYANDEEELNKVAIYGALDLYLDFINIFMDLLNLFGDSKN